MKRLLASGSGLLLLLWVIAPSALAANNFTWADNSSLPANTATSGLWWTSVASSADGRHLVATEAFNFIGSDHGDIWTSSDGGATWTDDSLLPGNGGTSGLDWTSVASSADGQKLAAVADSGGVWSSLDGGTTWTDVANFTMSGGLWAAVTMSADGKYLHAMPFAGDVWSSSDYGATWRNDTWMPGNGPTHQDWQTVGSSADGQEVVGGVAAGDIWITHDDGTTWVDNSALSGNGAMSGQSWDGIAVSANGQDIVATASGGDIWTSTNGGTSWTDASSLPGNGGTVNQQWRSVTMSADGQNVAATASGGDIWTSNDAGVSWDASTAGGPFSGQHWSSITSNITGGNLVALAGGLFQSGDIYTGTDTNLPQVTNALAESPVTAAAIAVQTPSDTTQTCATAVRETSLPKQDTGYTYPIGLVDVCYTTVLPTDQVSVTFVTNLSPSDVVPRDFNTATESYMTIPGATVTETTLSGHAALKLTYTITDNGALDSNPTVDSVTDPVGLAVVPVPDTGFGMPSQSNPLAIFITSGALLLIGVSLLLYGQKKPSSQRDL